MDVDAVIARVKQILVEEFELDEAAVVPAASLREDLQLDSLDGMDLIYTIEKEFGFRVDEKRLIRMRTVGEIYEYVREVAAARNAGLPAPGDAPAEVPAEPGPSAQA